MTDKGKPLCYFCRSGRMELHKNNPQHLNADVNVYHCIDCDLVQNFPLKGKDYSNLISKGAGSEGDKRHWSNFEEYERQQKGACQFQVDWVARTLSGHADNKQKNSVRILDAGCHTGLFLELLSRKSSPSWELFGLEPDGQAAQWGRQKHGLKIDQGYLEKYAHEADFEAIMLFEVLEHCIDPLSVLRQACYLLVPGGTLFIVVPDVSGMRSADDFFVVEHVFHFSEKTLMAMAQEAGLSPRASTLVAVPCFPAGGIKKTLKNIPFVYYWVRRILSLKAAQKTFHSFIKPGMIMATFTRQKET